MQLARSAPRESQASYNAPELGWSNASHLVFHLFGCCHPWMPLPLRCRDLYNHLHKHHLFPSAKLKVHSTPNHIALTSTLHHPSANPQPACPRLITSVIPLPMAPAPRGRSSIPETLPPPLIEMEQGFPRGTLLAGFPMVMEGKKDCAFNPLAFSFCSELCLFPLLGHARGWKRCILAL